MIPCAPCRGCLQGLQWMYRPDHPPYDLRYSDIIQSEAAVSLDVFYSLPACIDLIQSLDVIYRPSKDDQPAKTWSEFPWKFLLLQSLIRIMFCYQSIVDSLPKGSEKSESSLVDVGRWLHDVFPLPNHADFQSMLSTFLPVSSDGSDILISRIATWITCHLWFLPIWTLSGQWQNVDNLDRSHDALSFILCQAAIQIELSKTPDTDPSQDQKVEDSASELDRLDAEVLRYLGCRDSLLYRFTSLVVIWNQVTVRLQTHHGLPPHHPRPDATKANVIFLLSMYILQEATHDYLIWGIADRWCKSAFA